MKKDEINEILKQHTEYKNALFRRGYLITNKKDINLSEYPFYSLWTENNINEYKILVHQDQDFYKYEDKMSGLKAIMIGHAYNPFDMKYKEEELLKDSIEAYRDSNEKFFDKISEFTGIHLIVMFDKDKIIFVQDCAGMKSCYYGILNNEIYVTSHTQLVADICELEIDEYVKKLVKTKCYNIGNRYLPGNITSYKELKRLGPNTYLEYKSNKFKINRFYPMKPHDEIKGEEDFNNKIENIIDIMHKNCLLATKKWEKPAISLSGGMDSKTTLATANGLYDKFYLYSFISKEPEKVDAEVAHEICKVINQEHMIYNIPNRNEEIKDYNLLRKIIRHNTSYMMEVPDNEIRKAIFLYKLNDFDIELKSWVSETARVYFERKYGKILPKNLNERDLNIIQTRYFLHPGLMRKADKYYAKYLKEIGLTTKIENFENHDLCFWEFRWGSWGTNVIQFLDIGNKVTIPFNNRKLIEMLLSFNHNDRLNDKVHKEIIKKANIEIYNMNLIVKNKSQNALRKFIERSFFIIRTILYKSKIEE